MSTGAAIAAMAAAINAMNANTWPQFDDGENICKKKYFKDGKEESEEEEEEDDE